MNRDEYIILANKWISLWNAPVDWEVFDQIHADDFIDCSPGGRESSKKAFAAGLKKFIEVFSDIQTKVEDIILDETINRIAIRWSAKGHRHSPGASLNKKNTHISGIEIIEILGGKIIKRWGEWDLLDY